MPPSRQFVWLVFLTVAVFAAVADEFTGNGDFDTIHANNGAALNGVPFV